MAAKVQIIIYLQSVKYLFFVKNKLEVGAISSVMRDFLHGYYVMYEKTNYDRADTIFQKIIDISDADKYDRMVQIAAYLFLRKNAYSRDCFSGYRNHC